MLCDIKSTKLLNLHSLRLLYNKLFLPHNYQGMSLSGIEDDDVKATFIAAIKKDYPGMARHMFVGNDTVSVMAAGLPKGTLFLCVTVQNFEIIKKKY